MPCLPCRNSMMGIVEMASREGRGPTSDVPVNLGRVYGTHGAPFAPEGFLAPRLCMLCGSIFCPPVGPEHVGHEPVRVELRHSVAHRLLVVLEEHCRATRGGIDSHLMEEARNAVQAAYERWAEAHDGT